MPSGTSCDEGWSLITTQSECIHAAGIVGHEQRHNLDDANIAFAALNTYTAGCYLNNYIGDGHSDLLLHFNAWGVEGQCSPSEWGDGLIHRCYQICKQTGAKTVYLIIDHLINNRDLYVFGL